jgi:AraC-like DNA-binding protein
MARPLFEYVPTAASQSFIYKIDRDLWPVYHYHPEIDLLFALKNHGEFVSGDYVGRLEPGTLFMNGPNVPHALHPEEANEEDWSRPALAVLQFSAQSLGEGLLEKPEFGRVREFLAGASRGYEFHGGTRIKAGEMILAIREMSELERFLQVMKLLDFLASSDERTPLASAGYSPSLRGNDIGRIDEVIRFLQSRKNGKVTLDEAAEVAGMSPKTLCRFFKQNTGRTLMRYLSELRIGEACRRLMESNQAVTEIAFTCGFNNLSNFNRQFRRLKEMSPREFRERSRLDRDTQTVPMPASAS